LTPDPAPPAGTPSDARHDALVAGLGARHDVAAARTDARYVAIITDGNGRWARARGLPVNEGHNAGADTVKARLRDAAELGVRELTVYSFSTENWSRPPEEVRGLMEMFARRIASETPELREEGVRMRFIGRRQGVSAELVERMEWAEGITQDNTRITLFVAFNYGGRAEILDAARRFEGGEEEDFRKLLYAPDMHDPDLIVRTSGERRLSNYLLWQSAYSELVFRDELWPDFSRRALEESLAEFSARRRRFGGRGPESGH
jgi:undecaprenyl diphosphate synthase